MLLCKSNAILPDCHIMQSSGSHIKLEHTTKKSIWAQKHCQTDLNDVSVWNLPIIPVCLSSSFTFLLPFPRSSAALPSVRLCKIRNEAEWKKICQDILCSRFPAAIEQASNSIPVRSLFVSCSICFDIDLFLLQIKEDVESTELALAFQLDSSNTESDIVWQPQKQPVFAYLPLRSFGFRFIIQGENGV